MDSGTGDPVWRSDSPALRIAVIAALELEAKIPRAVVRNNPPAIYVSGPGRDRAFQTAQRAIADGATGLISFGLAGGLSPQAVTGAVVLPAMLASDAGEWHADKAWRNRLAAVLARNFELIDGPLFSAERVLATPNGKAALAARSGAAAVDMESAAVAQAAAEAGIPFIALRVIADGPDDELPAEVESLVTPDGQTCYRALFSFLASPRRLRLLISLAGKSRVARNKLKRVMHHLTRAAR